MVKNPYEILGVSQGAGMEEIKRAYRQRAKECHPDLHPEDPKANERMQQVNEAYNMLCNPEKYAARGQARPDPGRYGCAGGSRDAYGPYANQGSYGPYANRSGGQYTYHYSDAEAREAWRQWQQAWSARAERQQQAWSARAGQQQRRETAVVRPLRGVLRFVGGLMLFHALMTLLRFGLFGFFL